MGLHSSVETLGRIKALDRLAQPAASAVKRAVPPGWRKDLLSGSRLGHPLHPLLTDVPIGAFTSATVLDLVGGRRRQDAADTLVALGVLSALPTIAAGAADWSDTFGSDQRVGVVHACSNALGIGLYAWSLRARRRGDRLAGTVLGLAGMASLGVGGYLGGYLSYSRGVGVNNAFDQHPPEEWTPVMAEGELTVGKPARVEVGDATVLLYRSNGRMCAIGSRCSHAGGPLEEGDIDEENGTVRCPWHQSVFRLDDGDVVHGPASVPQAAYEVRVHAGQIEIRQQA